MKFSYNNVREKTEIVEQILCFFIFLCFSLSFCFDEIKILIKYFCGLFSGGTFVMPGVFKVRSLRFFIRPAELFLKNIYTHFEPQLDRIMSEMPQFYVSNTNQD